MRHSTLTAAATAAALGLGAPAASAMPAAALGQLRLAEGAALEKTVLFCDSWTCYWRPDDWGYDHPNPYWGWRRHYWWGWHRPESGWQRRSR